MKNIFILVFFVCILLVSCSEKPWTTEITDDHRAAVYAYILDTAGRDALCQVKVIYPSDVFFQTNTGLFYFNPPVGKLGSIEILYPSWFPYYLRPENILIPILDINEKYLDTFYIQFPNVDFSLKFTDFWRYPYSLDSLHLYTNIKDYVIRGYNLDSISTALPFTGIDSFYVRLYHTNLYAPRWLWIHIYSLDVVRRIEILKKARGLLCGYLPSNTSYIINIKIFDNLSQYNNVGVTTAIKDTGYSFFCIDGNYLPTLVTLRAYAYPTDSYRHEYISYFSMPDSGNYNIEWVDTF